MNIIQNTSRNLVPIPSFANVIIGSSGPTLKKRKNRKIKKEAITDITTVVRQKLELYSR